MSEQDELIESSEETFEIEETASVPEAEPEVAEEAGPEEKVKPEQEAKREESEAMLLVDLNTATDKELQDLPGIGPALAESIIDYRSTVHPFREPAEVTFVPGISQSMYDRIADQVTVSPVEPEIVPKLTPIDMEPEVEKEPVPAPVPPPPSAEPPLVEIVPAKGPGWGRILLVGLLSAILGAILALAVLWGINGTLDFLNEEALRPVWTQAGELEDRIKGLNTMLTDVEERLEAVHDLSDRLDQAQADLQAVSENLATVQGQMASGMEEFEGVQTALAELEASVVVLDERIVQLEEGQSVLQAQVGVMEEQVANAVEQVDRMYDIAARFDAFLSGLQELLNRTGESSPKTTPATSETSTPEPVVTIIPLATPSPSP